jgi:O-antigen ligase
LTRDLLLRRGWVPPLSLALFVDNVRGTPVRAAAVAAAALWGAAVVLRVRRRPALSPAFSGFFLWSAGGLFFSVYLSNTLNELCLLAAAWALFLGAATCFHQAPEERDFFGRALLLLALVKAAVALILKAPGGRLFLEPSDAGSANTAFIPMFLVLALLAGRTATGRAWRAAWWAVLAAVLWFFFRWNASAAFLGLGAGVPLEAAFRRKKRGWILGAAAAGVLVLAGLFSSWVPAPLRYNAEDPARFERLYIWADSLSLAKDHPAAGTALGTYEQYYPQYKSLPGVRTANFAHNDWLQVLCETGLPGFLLVLWCLAALGRVLADEERTAVFPGPSACLVVLGLWGGLYFVFRSDALLFTGALSAAFVVRPDPRPLGPGSRAGVIFFAGLLAGAALSQGVAQEGERRGGAAWEAGRFEEALGRFRAAARWNPWEPRFLDEQVECLRALNRKEETLSLLERAVVLKPRDVWLRRKLAVARLNLVGPEPARRDYAPILALAPSVPQFRREYEEFAVPSKTVK